MYTERQKQPNWSQGGSEQSSGQVAPVTLACSFVCVSLFNLSILHGFGKLHPSDHDAGNTSSVITIHTVELALVWSWLCCA